MPETIPMGIGALGFKNIIFKRKFRYTFIITNICGNASHFVPESFVRVAARPNLDIDEVEINFLNAKTWIPGKASWQTINVTYYDVATTGNKPLFDWLASVYNFTDPINLQMGSSRNDYAATGILKLWDGCGALLETWILNDLWPKSINFGDLDYASSDMCDIELTLRYSSVIYQSICPSYAIEPCCTGCQ